MVFQVVEKSLQGYLAHKKLPPARTLQQGPMVVLGGGGAPVGEVGLRDVRLAEWNRSRLPQRCDLCLGFRI